MKVKYETLTNGRAFTAYGFTWHKTIRGAKRLNRRIWLQLASDTLVERAPHMDDMKLVNETIGGQNDIR